MISRHIHRNTGVGCGIRLLAVLAYCQRRLSLAALVLLRLCLEMSILRHRCVK